MLDYSEGEATCFLSRADKRLCHHPAYACGRHAATRPVCQEEERSPLSIHFGVTHCHPYSPANSLAQPKPSTPPPEPTTTQRSTFLHQSFKTGHFYQKDNGGSRKVHNAFLHRSPGRIGRVLEHITDQLCRVFAHLYGRPFWFDGSAVKRVAEPA